MKPAPSGRQVELVCKEQRAVVVSVGAGIREYTIAGEPVLEGYPEDAVADAGRGQLLLPWPNRVRDGRYRAGRDLQLPLTEPDKHNAIHGLTRWLPWTLAAQGVATAAFRLDLPPQPGYPFQLRLDAVYRLNDDGLTVAVSAFNIGGGDCPVGAGAHPYLAVGAAGVDAAVLHVPAARRLLTDEQQIPVGEEPLAGGDFDFRSARPIGDTVLDTAYTGLDRDAEGVARVTLTRPGGPTATLWMDAAHTHVMVFTADTLPPRRRRTAVAVEPMTCAPNALQSGDGLRLLAPGDRFTARWGISVS